MRVAFTITVAVLVVGLTVFAGDTSARSSGRQRAMETLIPLFVEKPGKVNFLGADSAPSDDGATDTVLVATYFGDDAGGALVDLYLFDQTTGDVLRSATGQAVCDPCPIGLGPGPERSKRIVFDDLIVGAGGFPRSAVVGYAQAVTTGRFGDAQIVVLFGVAGATGGLATPGVTNWLVASERDKNIFCKARC